MSDTSILKKEFLDNVVKVGSIEETRSRMNIPYTTFREWENEDNFWASEIKRAENTWVLRFNQRIANLAKFRLLEMLENGVTERHTTRKTVYSPILEAEAKAEGKAYKPDVEVTTKTIYKGTPLAAITQALAMIPELVKSAERMAQDNALPAEKLKEVQTYIESFEDGLRSILSDSELEKLNALSNDDVVGNLQSILIGEKGGN